MTSDPCEADPDCEESLLEHVLDLIPTTESVPLALAKDGHVIMSPYNSEGVLRESCDVDICNGYQEQGEYYYSFTTFHPYILGCYGPGSNVTIS